MLPSDHTRSLLLLPLFSVHDNISSGNRSGDVVVGGRLTLARLDGRSVSLWPARTMTPGGG